MIDCEKWFANHNAVADKSGHFPALDWTDERFRVAWQMVVDKNVGFPTDFPVYVGGELKGPETPEYKEEMAYMGYLMRRSAAGKNMLSREKWQGEDGSEPDSPS
jgi:hypothetical protein